MTNAREGSVGAPRVSLCVPAWRGETVRRLLASVRDQTHPLSYELIVQDDASPHGVDAAFREMHRGEPHWAYRRNSGNLGGYDNIRACTEGARGQFVLMISDDDQLLPDAFATLDKVTELAERCGANAMLLYHRLDPKYGDGTILSDSLAWLRDVSVNVPAFISCVVWRRGFWESYPYHEYPVDLCLPQLDCFLDACMRGPIVASNRPLVDIGHAEDTNRPTFWFYTRHAPVDCYEYPALYRKVLGGDRLDPRTRLWVYARQLGQLRETYRKTLFMRHNEQFYHPSFGHFRQYHNRTIYAPFLLPLLWVLLETPIGAVLARRRFGNAERLPPRPAGTRGY